MLGRKFLRFLTFRDFAICYKYYLLNFVIFLEKLTVSVLIFFANILIKRAQKNFAEKRKYETSVKKYIF